VAIATAALLGGTAGNFYSATLIGQGGTALVYLVQC